MTNPIPSSNLWHTPASIEELYAMIDQFTGQEAALAAHVMMLTLNTCHRLVEQAAEETTPY